MHRAWVYKLKARYQAEGATAFEPRSRRPKTSPTATPTTTVELVLRIRTELNRPGSLGGFGFGPACVIGYQSRSVGFCCGGVIPL